MTDNLQRNFDQIQVNAERLPGVVADALAALERLAQAIADLEQQGICEATAYYREGRYLYLIYPSTNGAARQRVYVGNDPVRQQAALDSISRYKQWQQYKWVYGKYLNEYRSAAQVIQVAIELLTNKPGI